MPWRKRASARYVAVDSWLVRPAALTRRALCWAVVAQDDVIIRQGDVGDFFYVLDTGHCDIHVEGVGKVMDVGPGGSFGELALMYDAPRAATVVRFTRACPQLRSRAP